MCFYLMLCSDDVKTEFMDLQYQQSTLLEVIHKQTSCVRSTHPRKFIDLKASMLRLAANTYGLKVYPV